MNNILTVENLRVHIKSGNRELVAVEDVSFGIAPGQTLGIAGESGCGKSITCLAVTRLAAPGVRIVSGRVLLDETPLESLSEREFNRLRGKEFSMIFQDSISGLNPLMKVGRQVAEALGQRAGAGREETRRRVCELLGRVRLDDPEIAVGKYPHQLSGGQRQRVMIAMAIASGPRLLIADEPTTALDVTTQRQILCLLRDLKSQTGMGMILVSHDVSVIREMCDRILVMYSGRALETGPARQVLENPLHPYTAALIRSVVSPEKKGTPLHAIKGNVAPLEQRPRTAGCVFAGRCDIRCDNHEQSVPVQTPEAGRMILCHRKGGVRDVRG